VKNKLFELKESEEQQEEFIEVEEEIKEIENLD